MSHFLKERHNVIGGRNLLVGDKNLWLVEGSFLTLAIGDEECGSKTFVVGEAFGDLSLHIKTLAWFNGNDTFFTDFSDNVGDKFADFWVASANSSDFGDFLIVASDLLGGFVDTFDDFGASGFYALTKLHWIVTGSNKLVGLGDNIVGENSYSSSTVTGNFIEFLSGGFDEASANLVTESSFVGVAEIDGFGDSNAIMGDGWSTVTFFNDNVTTFWTESNFDCIIESFGAAKNFLAGFGIIKYFFTHNSP